MRIQHIWTGNRRKRNFVLEMFFVIFALISGLKLLFLPAYKSTDFEVHRNWLAITHSKPISQWYFEDSSEWTLDYPPFFAYFEYVLSHFAKYFDEKMLDVKNLGYSSESTVVFQRLSVIFADVIYAIGANKCIEALKLKNTTEKTVTAALLLTNVGLLFVDHIHFQYNGFLFGFLLLSIAKALEECYLQSALFFAVLLNLKHIFIYIAPAYVLFLFKFYCLRSGNPIVSLVKLGSVVVGIFLLSFGPFVKQLPQVFSRLFPFKRGLTHAYWAPNFWAVYNFADKALCIATGRSQNSSSNTGGLVQEFEHGLLPSIQPGVTFLLTGLFMVPCLVKLFLIQDKRRLGEEFIRAIVLCCCTSFMFGWHVHEKAILMVIIPLSLLATTSQLDAELSIFLGIVAHFSLFPLLFPPELLIVKIFLHLTFTLSSFIGLRAIFKNIRLSVVEKLYISGFIGLLAYEHLIQYLLKLSDKLQFLPIMLTSVYCSLGVIYFYTKFYYKFLSTKSSDVTKVKTK